MSTIPVLLRYGSYTRDQGWAIWSDTLRKLAQLQVYHFVNCLRAGVRPAECIPHPPPGRTLVEFAAAAWLPFYGRSFRDPTVPGHHREPNWLAFTAAIEERIRRGQSLGVPELASSLYRDVVEAVAEADLAHEAKKWDDPCPFGPFRYDDPHEGYSAMHFHNAYMPESPFQDPGRLHRMLLAMVEDIERRGLDVRRVGVDSWVNHIRPFQACFPPSFAASITPTSIDNKGGKGWWGQFILRTAGFNEERAESLRRTRKFDFWRAHAECSFDEFRRHVRAKF